MKKIALALALLSVSFAQAQIWKKQIKESGIQTSVTKTTTSYDKISVSGSFKVELVAGKEGNITIKGDENIISHIEAEVKNNTLNIHLKKNKTYSYTSDIIITVPFEKISALIYIGSGELKTINTINTTDLEVKFLGSGKVDLDINTENLTIDLTGSRVLNISGKTKELNGKLIGSGTLNLSNLTTQNAKINLTGSGNIKVDCTNTLIAKVIGSGLIEYKKNPKVTEKSIIGSGDISEY
ncbi:head GIN domain-containing protein [uncultured Flavobacterium sp.]|uniref:head GIN domain-containing protein n=1 Tax=uncultured Flavobacterium sp. TaxID=165435 RepID=UPI0030CA57FF